MLLSTSVLAQDCVVLLHGLARSSSSMEKLEQHLEREGYQAINYNYPSTQFPVEKLAATSIKKALSQCDEGKDIHFVTHSMGGILVRQYLKHNEIDNLKNVVMLGPPNKGSEVVDALKSVPGFSMINGPAGSQLGTDSTSVPNSLGKVNFHLGVIAGTSTMNPLLSTYLPNPDDGKVSVESTKVEGMADHISLPVTHTFMMRNDGVISQVTHFLHYGYFQR
ncbi:alpha/beta hydrolase [Veronia nyctiphanis]|uniref:Alpha/beta hydrolase n=2 Tax=Veronia nyctiphanis TaxID=1278244 RepID=A0A4Q0YRJ9_9GAMM|nr:alpha/beta hydrolase [Veronia nyctiphanis]